MGTGIRVTAEDLYTGEIRIYEVENDYVLVTTGTCDVANVEYLPLTATHVLTIRGVAHPPEAAS